MSIQIRSWRKFLFSLLSWSKFLAICVVLATLEVFSIYSTSTGLYAFFNEWHQPVMITLAVCFHVLGTAWLLKFREGRRGLALIPYAIFSAVFIGYSWSFHWAHFRGLEVSGQDLRAKISELQMTAFKVEAGFTLIAQKTNELAEYSQRRADEEATYGNTCGDRSGNTQGKRYLVRIDDNREAKSLAGLAASQLPAVEKLIARTNELASAKDGIVAASGDLDAVSNELRAIVTDNSVIADIRGRVDQRLHLAQNGYDVPGYGLTRCPDPARDALLGGVLNAAKMPGLTVVQVMKPDSVSEAQKRVWSRAINSASAVWFLLAGGHADPAMNTERLDRYDYGSLLTASFVEFSVLMCLLWLPRPPRGIADLADPIHDLSDERNSDVVIAGLLRLFTLNPEEEAILGKIEDHIWWPDPAGDPILVVPIAPREHSEPVLYRIAEVLVEADRAQIPRSWAMHALNLRWVFSAPRHLRKLARLAVLRLYKVDRHAYRQLMLALALRSGNARPSWSSPDGGPVTPNHSYAPQPEPKPFLVGPPVLFKPAAE